MAPLPGRQPGVRQPGDGAGARAPRHARLKQLALAAFAGLLAIGLAERAGVVGRGAVPDLARVAAAGVLLFGICGFGIVRLALPDGLRRYELLWVLPVGACACALSLTVLGYLYVPFTLSLPLVLLSGLALAVVAVRRRGLPDGAAVRRIGWPVWIAALVAAVALIPLFRAGFVTVVGEGQDAHMAVGTAQFLQNHHPTDKAIEEPVDEVWLVWRSKPPIYFALAAHASVAGMEPYQVISTQQALLLFVALCGFFLLALEVLRAPPWAAVTGAAVVGLDRMVMHTAMHPYFNQTWGLMTMPFAFVLAWWAVTARSRGGLALLGLLLAIGTFAYPLMLPIPLIALAVWLWPERHRLGLRRRVGGLWHGRRTLAWLVPLTLVLLLPLAGVAEKMGSAANVVLNPTRTLQSWGGDLRTYYEEAWFFAAAGGPQLLVIGPLLIAGVVLAFREPPKLLARGFVVLFAFTAVFVLWFRLREFGFYFHFKALAFVAPLVLITAVAGLGRLRAWSGRAAVVAVAVLLAGAYEGASDELETTFDQLPKSVLQLRELTADVPEGDSIRLDLLPTEQNWIAFMLHKRPLCSQRPLLRTSYPRVPKSRRADFILTKRRVPAPADATGGPVRRLDEFVLWRASPGLPGRENCSREMVQGVTQVDQ